MRRTTPSTMRSRSSAAFRIAHAIALPVVLLIVLASGCGGDGGGSPTETPPPGAEDYGCVDGKAGAYAAYQVYWGDIHSHTVFSEDAASQDPPPGPPADALAFAADPGGGNLDFVAITDHAETVSSEEWTATIAACKAAAGAAFIPFVGFEYTNVSHDPGRGHKCVLFKDPDHVPAAPIGADVCPDPVALWSQLDASPAAGQYMTIPHHPAKGVDYGANMATDWDQPYVNGSVQRLVEIYSVHGNSELAGCEEPVDRFQEDRSVDAALAMWRTTGDSGYKLGIVGSTDNHLARPGCVAEVDENVALWEGEYTGGLAAAWSPGLTRDGIWDALSSKRAYATSGARIVLEFTAKAGTTVVPMGGTLAIGAKSDLYLHVRAVSEAGVGIQKIQIIKNGTLLVTAETDHLDYKDPGISEDTYYRVKVFQNATAVVKPTHTRTERAWSSPIWIDRQ